MGVHIWLADEEGTAWVGRDTVNKYHDFLMEKEQRLPESAGSIDGKKREEIRQRDIKHLESRGGSMTLGEKISSQASPLRAVSLPDQEVWSDTEQLESLRDQLREAKREVQATDDSDTNWERTFEMRHIALVEFALKHGYGITAP
ncbi:hypothetical protein EGH22_20140 [Halomicroarcula sp. F28]|uniref:hypothetical protein n=1 Tax=Haloarcula salinisoli TaxID=2487746 RepID=UPI001C7357C4|nr:hypothetical protein [Halomicroarcula salinisoli]MBX0288645.1 hypothetical protein [Halomicroarcula salinisoli]